MGKLREREWQTHLGNSVSVQGCSDEHLANTIQWVSVYSKDAGFKRSLKYEAERRGLTKAFLDKAQYPYKDGLGNYIVWNFEIHEPMIVGSYTRG